MFHLAKTLLTVERQKSLPHTHNAGGDAEVGDGAAGSTSQTQRDLGEAATLASCFFFPLCFPQKPGCWHLTDSRHAVCARTFLGHAISPEKIALSPGTAAGRRLGRAVQSPGRERCSLQKSCSQHFFFSFLYFFFFLGDVVLKEEPLRDALMERLRWVWGGKCCYFGKIPLSSSKSPF